MIRRPPVMLIVIAFVAAAFACRAVVRRETAPEPAARPAVEAPPMRGSRGLPADHPPIPPPLSLAPGHQMLGAMLSIHAHAFWPERDFPVGYSPMPLEDAVRLLKNYDGPQAALFRRRAVARLAAFGLARRDFRAAIQALGADPRVLQLRSHDLGDVSRDVVEMTIFDALDRYFPLAECKPLEFLQSEPEIKVSRVGGSVSMQAEIRVQRPYDAVARAIDPQKWDQCSPLFSPPENTFLIESHVDASQFGSPLIADLDANGQVIAAAPIPAGTTYPSPKLMSEHFRCVTAGCPSEANEFFNQLTVEGWDEPHPTTTIPHCSHSVVDRPRYNVSYECNTRPNCVAPGVKIDDGGLWAQDDGGTFPDFYSRVCLNKKLEFESELRNAALEAAWRVLAAEMLGLLAHLACCPIEKEDIHFGAVVEPSCVTHHE